MGSFNLYPSCIVLLLCIILWWGASIWTQVVLFNYYASLCEMGGVVLHLINVLDELMLAKRSQSLPNRKVLRSVHPGGNLWWFSSLFELYTSSKLSRGLRLRFSACGNNNTFLSETQLKTFIRKTAQLTVFICFYSIWALWAYIGGLCVVSVAFCYVISCANTCSLYVNWASRNSLSNPRAKTFFVFTGFGNG